MLPLQQKTKKMHAMGDINGRQNEEKADSAVSSEELKALRRAVEVSTGRQYQTPRDFDLLSESIHRRTGEMLSRNTLRRIWGGMKDVAQPHRSTLSILARFVGYAGYEAFVEQLASGGGDVSAPVLGRRLTVSTSMKKGDRLRLTWQPDRVCDVEYNGSQHFRVIASENTKLKPDDTFLCAIIIEGQPLYLDQLQQGNDPPSTYICGKLGGVRFEVLKK